MTALTSLTLAEARAGLRARQFSAGELARARQLGVAARVVSVPCFELLFAAPAEVQRAVIGDAKVKIGVEAAIRQGWDAIIGLDGAFVGMSSFGASAPYNAKITSTVRIAQAHATAAIGPFHSGGPAIPIRNCGEIVGSVLQTSAAVRRTQPSSWSGYNALIDNVPDRRIDIGIPRQRVFAR